MGADDKSGPTPRTDAVAPHLNLSHQDIRRAAWSLRELAHQLERELREVQDKLIDLNEDYLEVHSLLKSTPSATEPFLLWRSRIDCWYEPHRDIGKKPKDPKRVVRWVVLEAPNSEEAIKRARDWAERTASPTQGRRWLRFDHRQTGSFPLPWDLDVSDDRSA